MTARVPPPVPPANRSDKGPSGPGHDKDHEATHRKPADNTAEQGETANITQNTTNAGHQQGR